jgi:hypothetical protein
MCNPVTVFNPERLILADSYLGYEYEVTCNGLAVRCGYVRIPAGHPWHGADHWELDAQAHGGVNFSAPDRSCDKGGPDDAWWLGFDCGHAFDAFDPVLPGYEMFAELEARMGKIDDAWPLGSDFARKIRSLGYVARECRRLIWQADYAGSVLPWNRRLELV